jgi:alpha-1,6-mannosyltransferase
MSARSGAATSRRAAVGLVVVLAGYLLIEAVAGAPNSPLVPGLPAGVGPPGWTSRGAQWLGLDGLTRTQLTVVALAIVAMILAAFLVVVAEARAGRLAVRAAVGASAVAVALAVAGPVLLSRDATSYGAYGRVLAIHHSNPYVVPPSRFTADPFVRAASPQWVDDTTVYGPAFTLASAAVVRAWPGSPGAVLGAFRVLAGLAVLGTVLLVVVAAARWGRPERAGLGAVVVGLNPVVVVHTVGGGHNDALVALGLAAALALAGPGEGSPNETWRTYGVTVALVLATLVKSVAGVALVVWWWQLVLGSAPGRRVRRTGPHVALAAAVSLAFAAPFLSSARVLWSTLSAASREGWASGPGLVMRGARAVGRSISGPTTAEVLAAVVAALFLVTFGFAHVTWWRRRPAAPLAETWAVALLLFALAAPYLLPWYALWFLPFLALLVEERWLWIGLACAGLLCLSGIPAEAGSAPSVWHHMVLAVHFAVAPAMLLLLLVGIARALEHPRRERAVPP